MNAPILSDKACNEFALYIVTSCASEMFLQKFENTLQTEGVLLKREKKRLFHDLLNDIKRIHYKYDQLVEFGMFLGRADGKTEAENFDALLFDANAFCAMAVRLYNATSGKPERMAEILQYLQQLAVEKAPFPDSLADYYETRVKVGLKEG